VDVLLHDDVAAAGEQRVLVAHDDGVRRGVALGVLGAVDEAEEVAQVERAEAVDLVGDPRRAAQARAQVLGQLEAQVEAVRADVEQQVAGRRRRRGCQRDGR
jgi:hypothetical protein